MAKDHYVVLGVDANASPQQVTSAYVHWAKELGPQRADNLREVQKAYSVIGHPERRRAYDLASEQQQVGHAKPQSRPRAEPLRAPESSPASPATFPISLLGSQTQFHPSFEELFDRFWSNFELVTRPKAERVESLTLEVPISREEARVGGTARILIPARAECPTCLGHGELGVYECWRCEGQGALTADYPLEVPYPAGLVNEGVAQVPLDQFGIRNFYLTVRFRVTDE